MKKDCTNKKFQSGPRDQSLALQQLIVDFDHFQMYKVIHVTKGE